MVFRGGLRRISVSPRAQGMVWGQGTEKILRNPQGEGAGGWDETNPKQGFQQEFHLPGRVHIKQTPAAVLGTALGCRSSPHWSTFTIPGEICIPCQSQSKTSLTPKRECSEIKILSGKKSYWTIPVIKSILTSGWAGGSVWWEVKSAKVVQCWWFK